MKHKSLTINSIYNIIRTFVTLVFPLLTFMYASRILGVDKIGAVEFSKNFVGYFALLASLGINNYGIREGARLRDSRKKFSKFVHEILLINICSIIVAYILFFITLYKVQSLSEYHSILLIFSITILFTPLGVEWLYGALEEYRYITLRTILFQIFAILVLFIFVKDASDYLWYSVVLIISSVGSNIMNLLYMHNFVDFKYYGYYDLRIHIYPIFMLFILAISNNLYSYIDTTMIGFIANNTEVGFYSAALKVNRIVVNILGAIGAVAMPRLSYVWKNGDMKAFEKIAKNIINILLMFSIPCFIGILCLSKSILLIFCGEKYLEARITLQLLSIIIVILSISTFFNMHILLPINKEVQTLTAIISGLVVNVGLNLILIPNYGKNGAAIGSVIGELIVFIIGLVHIKQIFKIHELFMNLPQYIISSLPIIAIHFFSNELFSNYIMQCTLTIILSIISYLLILACFFKNELIVQNSRKILLKLKSR